MPKRKHSDVDYESLRKKLKKIEEMLHRKTTVKRRKRAISSSSSSSRDSSTQQCSQSEDHEISSPVTVHEPDDLIVEPAPDPVAIPTESNPGISGTDSGPTGANSGPTGVDSGSPAEENILPAEDADPTVLEETVALDSDILEILGVDPTDTNKYGKELQKDLAVRFEHIATTGLTKEARKELTEKYLVPSNCKLTDAPALNLEVKAALSEAVVKRDKAIESKQKVTAAALSSLGEAITHVLSSKNKDAELLRLLMDTGRMLCDSQHNDSLTRRNFVVTSVKKEMKDSLQNTKIDGYLFGTNLTDTLKAAKAISKSGAELKAPPAKTTFNKNNTPSTSKNWKNTAARKTAAASSKSRVPMTPAASKNQRASSSKQSSSQRQHRSHR